MEIQRLEPSEGLRLKKLRIEALKDAPMAFATTLQEAQSLSDAQWSSQLLNLETFFAIENGVDLGMVRGEPNNVDTDSAFLISMWVSPKSRGSGAGEALISAVIDWARKAGFRRLELDVADDNAPAIALYERMNFRATGETGSLPPPREHITEHRLALTLTSVLA